MVLNAKAVRDYVRTHSKGKRISQSFIHRLDEMTATRIEDALRHNGSHKTITSDCLTQVPSTARRGR